MSVGSDLLLITTTFLEGEFFDCLGLVGRVDWKPRNEISRMIESEVTREDTSRFTAVIIGLVYSKSASR